MKVEKSYKEFIENSEKEIDNGHSTRWAARSSQIEKLSATEFVKRVEQYISEQTGVPNNKVWYDPYRDEVNIEDEKASIPSNKSSLLDEELKKEFDNLYVKINKTITNKFINEEEDDELSTNNKPSNKPGPNFPKLNYDY